nr:oplophorus-luciferin 2-monooxygenase non-catalytic subunit-like [Procambarus clarkii]
MINLSSGVRRGLVCVAMVVVLVAAYPDYNGEKGRAFPCPNDDDIDPCTCTYDGTTFSLNLTCDGLTGEDQLDQIFSSAFPVKAFTMLTLTNSNISTLTENVFHTISFEVIMLINNQLETVDSKALSSSYSTLQSFFLTQIGGETLSLTINDDLQQFKILTTIYISGPYDNVPTLTSATLTTAILNVHELTDLPPETFTAATALETIIMEDTKIETILEGTFSSLKSLKSLTLTGANINTLTASSMAFSSNLTLLDLHLNNINSIDKAAFQGISGDVNIMLNKNSLVELTEQPFLELLMNTTGSIDVSDNPLTCGCDLRWLVSNKDLDWARLVGLNSACDIDGTYDKDTLLDFLEYQCSTPASSS